MADPISGGLMALGGVAKAWQNSRLRRILFDMEGKQKINDLLQQCLDGALQYGTSAAMDESGARSHADGEMTHLRKIRSLMVQFLENYRVDKDQLRKMETVLETLKAKRIVLHEDLNDLQREIDKSDKDYKKKMESDPRWRTPSDRKTLNKAIKKVDEAVKSAKTKAGRVYRTRWGKIVRARAGKDVDEDEFEID